MVGKEFGKLMKQLRLRRGLSLRGYCREFGLDPAYVSRMERGLLPPPVDVTRVEELAASLGLPPDSQEWDEFVATAAVSAGRIPSGLLSEAELVKRLPVILCGLENGRLEGEKLEQFVAYVRGLESEQAAGAGE